MVVVDNRPNHVFRQIEEIEGKDAQLELLSQMDLFMVQQDLIGRGFLHEDKRKQSHPLNMQAGRRDNETFKCHLRFV